jgi:hypothetical protein
MSVDCRPTGTPLADDKPMPGAGHGRGVNYSEDGGSDSAPVETSIPFGCAEHLDVAPRGDRASTVYDRGGPRLASVKSVRAPIPSPLTLPITH